MKPVVYYESVWKDPVVGQTAGIRNLSGHPSQAIGEMVGRTVITSQVVVVEEDGSGFETLNTLYRKR